MRKLDLQRHCTHLVSTVYKVISTLDLHKGLFFCRKLAITVRLAAATLAMYTIPLTIMRPTCTPYLHMNNLTTMDNFTSIDMPYLLTYCKHILNIPGYKHTHLYDTHSLHHGYH
jgi:hypothetical protein